VSTKYETDGTVLDPKEILGGMSYGDWAAAWSNWLFSYDPSRAEAEGPMVFLRGNIEYYKQPNNTFYDRTGNKGIVIPEHKAIFIPVLTAMHFIGSQYEGQMSNYEDQIRHAARNENDKSGGIWAMIQMLGKGWEPMVSNLMNYRAASSAFKMRISEDSPFLEMLTLKEKMGPGEYEAVTDGFFIIIKPSAKSLPAGTDFRLRFGGKGRTESYWTDAIYDIHITPRERSQTLVRDITPDMIKNKTNLNLGINIFGAGSIQPEPLEKLPT
jgi:hypothetical protein